MSLVVYPITACKKYGIACVDLFTECNGGINLFSEVMSLGYNDKFHPNDAGYNAYFIPKIYSKMEELLLN